MKIGGAAAGRKRKMYPWGNALTPDGTHRANVWQGTFPTSNSVEDGYAGVAPVFAFGPQNELGMYNMIGNVWEWVDDYWSVDHPRTPKNSPPLFDPRGAMSTGERTKKGGSYMCHKSYCHRYRVHARSQNLGYGKPWVSLCQACSGDGAPSKIGSKIIHEPSKA